MLIYFELLLGRSLQLKEVDKFLKKKRGLSKYVVALLDLAAADRWINHQFEFAFQMYMNENCNINFFSTEQSSPRRYRFLGEDLGRVKRELRQVIAYFAVLTDFN